MWISSKEYRHLMDSRMQAVMNAHGFGDDIRELQEELEDLKSEHAEQTRNHRIERYSLIAERDEWRTKYELLSLTPEVKADTEAAFKRGEDAARNKFNAWLQTAAQNLSKIIKDESNVD